MTRGFPKMTGGLPDVRVVPRNRIELLTRGFSVRPDLVRDLLDHLTALGRLAAETGRAIAAEGEGHHCDEEITRRPAITADWPSGSGVRNAAPRRA
jgi:hypothetical protein